jgi:hypothetical protein
MQSTVVEVNTNGFVNTEERDTTAWWLGMILEVTVQLHTEKYLTVL